MRRIWTGLAGVTLAAALAGAAAAMIPPSYKILVVAPDEETEASSRALIEAMTTFNAFFKAEPDFRRSEIEGCLTAKDQATCVHGKVSAKTIDERARPVIIVARPVKPGVSTWTCYGSGVNPKAPPSGTVTIDLSAALFGPAEARTANRRKAMDCIYAAETESYVN